MIGKRFSVGAVCNDTNATTQRAIAGLAVPPFGASPPGKSITVRSVEIVPIGIPTAVVALCLFRGINGVPNNFVTPTKDSNQYGGLAPTSGVRFYQAAGSGWGTQPTLSGPQLHSWTIAITNPTPPQYLELDPPITIVPIDITNYNGIYVVSQNPANAAVTFTRITFSWEE